MNAEEQIIKRCEESPDRPLSPPEARVYIRHLCGEKPREQTLWDIIRMLFK